MIRFQDITIEDRELILGYTFWGEQQNCDLSFANMVGWRFLYGTQFAELDGCLVFRFWVEHHLAYMMPVPKPRLRQDGAYGVERCEECLAGVVKALREDAVAMGHPFLMVGVGSDMSGLFERHFPGLFEIKPDRDYHDYIYERERLATLTGKKLQAKRNHVNKFKSLYPHYEYRELTADLMPQCLALEKRWRAQSKGDADSETEGHLLEELRFMFRTFHRWEALQLTGGALFVDGRMVAFTYGCPINHCTFDICVEKADMEYEGAFSVINQEFARHLPAHYTYINREEDLGEPGLRRAKLSYRPSQLLEKSVVMERRPLASFGEPAHVKEEVMALWREVFQDPEPFVRLYFTRVYRGEYNYCCRMENRVVAALQMLPYTMLYHGREVKTVYVSGVCTMPACRGEGVGSNLMRQAHHGVFGREALFATLIPAEEWLLGWYARMGYAPVIACTPPPADPRTTSFAGFDALQRAKRCVLLHDAEGYEVICEDARLEGDAYRLPDRPVPAMLRVIHVLRALELYAEVHPETNAVWRVEGDADIPENNAYYVLGGGQVRRTDEPLPDAIPIHIVRLAELLFPDGEAEMNLMLN